MSPELPGIVRVPGIVPGIALSPELPPGIARFFSCKVVGEVLRDIMEQHPSCEMTVYCGHTRGSGQRQIFPDMKVFTGEAKYGSPKIHSIIEVR